MYKKILIQPHIFSTALRSPRCNAFTSLSSRPAQNTPPQPRMTIARQVMSSARQLLEPKTKSS